MHVAAAWSGRQAVDFVVGAFGRNLAAVTMKMFSRLIYFIKTFYKFDNFNTISRIFLQEIAVLLLFNAKKVLYCQL
jgi:hypothetical protein